MLDGLPINEVSEADLRRMIEDAEPESRTLDYKRDGFEPSERGKKEFVKDVASFANTLGGHLVIGMDEERGVASALVGLEGDPDAECLRLESLARTGLQPRLNGLRIRPVPLANGRFAVVVRVPRSLNPPHRVVTGNSNSFWARDGAGKYEPDVDQLRGLFGFATELERRVEDFRLDRVAKTKAGEGLVRALSDGVLLVHVMPLSIAAGQQQRLSAEKLQRLFASRPALAPIGAQAYDEHFNLDGLVLKSTSAKEPSAVQIYKNGFVESASTLSNARDPQAGFGADEHEVSITRFVANALAKMNAAEITALSYVHVTLLNVDGALYRFDTPETDTTGRRFDRPDLLLSGVTIEDDAGGFDERTVAELLRPVFDELANAAGLMRSPGYDEEGNWRSLRER